MISPPPPPPLVVVVVVVVVVRRPRDHLWQVISSISTTRAFAAEKAEEAMYAKGMRSYQDCVVRTARVYYVYSSTTSRFQ